MFSNFLIAAVAASGATGVAATNSRPPSSEAGLISAFVQAWDAADPASLAQLFEPGGRLVIPAGTENSGRDAIRGFYTAAFERGYRGSKGGARIARVTKLADTFSLVEGEWSIRNAKQTDGSPRESESGQFSAIVRADRDGWRLLVLREMILAD